MNNIKERTSNVYNMISYNFKFDKKEHLDKMMLYASQKFGKYHKSDILLFEHDKHGIYAGIINITFIDDLDKIIKECIDYFYTYSIKLVTF